MSPRAEIWQHLTQFRDRIVHHMRSLLGTWPGLLTLALLLLTLALSIAFFERASIDASAQAPATSSLAQIATRIPTLHAVVVSTPTTTATRPSATSTSTPTHTPLATATQIARSPLLAETTTPTQVVPLPANLTGPHIVPVDVITKSPSLSSTVSPELAPIVTATGSIAASEAAPLAVTPTNTPGGLILLVPTATPMPTLSITEALEQPVQPGGMAGIAAAATAVAPMTEQSATEMPTVTEAEPAAEAAPTAIAMPTPDGNVRVAHVPILMYHYLSAPPADADMYRLDLSVTPDLFAAQLDAMQQAGYTTISLYTLIDYLTTGSPLPEKPVVLTFDDGYRDNYTNAFPMLRDRGMTATFFIVTDFINDQRPEYLTWDMVREMYAAGMSIEGHGRNHVSLAKKDRDYLIWQALGTYETIEAEIGVRPHFICYPAGEYDQQTIDIFRSANYWAGFTTKQGATHRSDDLFQMMRIRVRGTTSPEELLRLLALDW
jgi:peptidoglycan/xylan/chitin deacetylase (PgdA/CDA1 family)